MRRLVSQVILLPVLSFSNLLAQSPAQTNSGPTTPALVPLSGRSSQPGSVTATQSTTNAGGSNSVNLINSAVSTQGSISGSTPQGKDSGQVLPLTLSDAISRGLRFNLGAIAQSSAVMQAEGQARVARSALRPNLNSVISEEVERLNLRTAGVLTNAFPETAQFNFFDARAARLHQTIFDLVQIENLRAANHELAANVESARNTRDLIVLAVGGAYLEVIVGGARVSAAAAEAESSRVISQQAADRLNAGLAARIDATRSRVQYQTDEQRKRSLEADLETQKLRLSRIIGLPPGQRFSVTEDYGFFPLTDLTLDGALNKAYAQRSDVKAATEGVHAAESGVKAARAGYLPNLSLSADWGASGLRPDAEAHSVYTVAGTLTIPLYEGGRVAGETEQARAALRQRQAELEDVRGQVDQDVRQAFINLDSAADQVSTAKSNIDLAHETLAQARDRFAAGISDTVELVQAEQSVIQADNDYISAVFEHNLAKIALARAMGNAEQGIAQLLHK